MTLVVAALAAVTGVRAGRKFSAPNVGLHASRDPAVIGRGRYLVQGPAHCVDCHGVPEKDARGLGDGGRLAGGFVFQLPVAKVPVPNITSDIETGIGGWTDEDIARVLRHSVRPDGSMVLPFMPFANLTDEDLVAVVSFLRTVPPVKHDVPKADVNALGKVVLAWVLEPRGPSATPPKSLQREPTPEYGKYLANSVANCVNCHTKLDMKTGALDGPVFAGGALHESSLDPSKKFVSPNLTPHPRWGWLQGWTEDDFANRLRRGSGREGSPMPWTAFGRFSEDDARAIFRYLKTLPAAPGGPDARERNPELLAAD